MEINFQFSTASKVIFGAGKARSIQELPQDFGRNILLVTGSDNWRHDFIYKNLVNQGYDITFFQIPAEPAIMHIAEGTRLAGEKNCSGVIGLGGGSALDGAKAIAALAPNKGEITDYLEVVGKGKRLEQPPLPYMAIPTTAGTGAEVTKNAVILSPEHQVKVSLRSDLMFPRMAIIDPELTFSMPPSLTAQTGIDALTHLLESFVSNQSNPFIDALCREGMHRISTSLERAFKDGSNLQARSDMAYASMLGGMALANVKLGAVHGFAGPLGGMIPASHGWLCASLLPAVMRVNLRAVTHQKQKRFIEKYQVLGQILTGNPEARAIDGIEWVERLSVNLQVPRLAALGLAPSVFPGLIEKAKNASSMKGNPVELNDEELQKILEQSF